MYVCDQCGQESVHWVGKCPACGAWNSFKEIKVAPVSASVSASVTRSQREKKTTVKPLHTVRSASMQRIDTQDAELNRVLGGGIVAGSLILLGGEPGIGKSTLLLQTILNLSDTKVLYVSAEESESQIKLRADRLMSKFPDWKRENCFIFCESQLENIYQEAERLQPQILVIDSVQAISSEQGEAFPGSPSQVRTCTVSLLRFAKETGIPVLLVGHITKDGALAGPKILEHIVDAVLQFEGDRQHIYRVLRVLKNRFGSTDELGLYEMQGDGLRAVDNPSELLLSSGMKTVSGVAIASAIEGARPLLVETQALVSTAAYGMPQRSATGFDLRRLNMLLAVLEKRAKFKLAQKDVFLNIAGGIRVSDTANDLSVIVAVLSSNFDVPILESTCMAGEVGLTGEIRPVTRIVQRIAEAERQGFQHFLLPALNMRGLHPEKYAIQLIPVATVSDALRQLFS